MNKIIQRVLTKKICFAVVLFSSFNLVVHASAQASSQVTITSYSHERVLMVEQSPISLQRILSHIIQLADTVDDAFGMEKVLK